MTEHPIVRCTSHRCAQSILLRSRRASIAGILCLLPLFLVLPPKGEGQADLANGNFRNPILYADYSDPDVIRSGRDFYLVASSFHFMPGIPILHSRDLVNWEIIGHVYPRLDLSPDYDLIGGNRYGGGAWAPSIRFHAGRYYVYFPTPDEGIFQSNATSPYGPWTKPVAVLSGKGLEDPCSFWDDDGQAYLIHSRLGAGPLILHRMNAEGTAVLDEGNVIVDDPAQLPTLEGPKLYKRNGYYYIFAPYGGVWNGSQVVLRAKNIFGPYEHRTVLEQGQTSVTGPHQGGYVETPDGKGWFVHFHAQGAYGRIVYLEPVRWKKGWPVIGASKDGSTEGVPVTEWKKPVPGQPIEVPSTSDEFDSAILKPQWEWNHNPDDTLWSLHDRPGFLRLRSGFAEDLYHARNTLTELSQDPAYSVTVSVDLKDMTDGQHMGLALFSEHACWMGVIQSGSGRQLHFESVSDSITGPRVSMLSIQLRVEVRDEFALFSYSEDNGHSFTVLGKPTRIQFSWWKGARPAVFNFTTKNDPDTSGIVDVDWVHYKRQ